MLQLTFARMYHHTPIFTAFDNVNGQVSRSQSSRCAIGRVVIIKHSAITCHHTLLHHLPSHPITSHTAQGRTEGGVSFGSGSDSFYE